MAFGAIFDGLGHIFDGFGDDVRVVWGCFSEACFCVIFVVFSMLLESFSSRRLCLDTFGNELL